MLALFIAQLVTTAPSCQERCAADTNRCYSSCRDSRQCSHHCDVRSSDCTGSCEKVQAKADAAAAAKEPAMPCGTEATKPGGKAVMRPCTDQENKLYNDALNSPALKQMLKCKDANGRPGPCKEDLERQKAVLKELTKDGLCKDAEGNAQVCPEAMKRAEKSLKAQ